MRYHVLRAAGPIKKVIVCAALLAGSYLISGLINASPITQQRLAGASGRGRVIVVAPDAPAEPAAVSADTPAIHVDPAPPTSIQAL